MRKIVFGLAVVVLIGLAAVSRMATPIQAHSRQQTVPTPAVNLFLPWVALMPSPTATNTPTATLTPTPTATATATATVVEPQPTATSILLPTPPSDAYFNIAALQGCAPNAGVTYVRGTTYVNGVAQSGYLVAFSWAADGPIVAYIQSGPHKNYEGWSTGFYSHILQAGGPREGDWYFWIIDENQDRISEIAYVHTDGVAGDGKCQQAVIDFDSRSVSQSPTATSPTATSTTTVAATPDSNATPTHTPTYTPTPVPGAVDFQLVQHYLVDVVENGGWLDGDSVHCGEKHELRVQVVNAQGSLLNGVTVEGIWTKEVYVTGQQGKGVGTVEYLLWESGEDVRVSKNANGVAVTSEVAGKNTTRTREIADAQLIQARYCKDGASCAAFKEQYGCNGHFSWRAVFQERQ